MINIILPASKKTFCTVYPNSYCKSSKADVPFERLSFILGTTAAVIYHKHRAIITNNYFLKVNDSFGKLSRTISTRATPTTTDSITIK